MVCIKRPQCDTNEGCHIEVTVTSSEELHAQAEKEDRKEKKRAARGLGRGWPTTWVHWVAACAHASPREARKCQMTSLRRVDIYGLAHRLQRKGSLFVGKDEE